MPIAPTRGHYASSATAVRDLRQGLTQLTLTPQPTDPLLTALDKLRAGRWAGKRSCETLYSQGRQAVEALRAASGHLVDQPHLNVVYRVQDVTPLVVTQAIEVWLLEKLAPDTIRKRLNVLRAMGVDLGKAEDRPRLPKKLPPKWWLSPADEKRLCEWLAGPAWAEPSSASTRAMTRHEARLLSHYIRFVTRTGLRVEEALRVTSWSLSPSPGNTVSLMVDGTKTATSRAKLPLTEEAFDHLSRVWGSEHGAAFGSLWSRVHYREAHDPAMHDREVFPFTYERLATLWEHCRKFLGVSDNPTATLKALRRSAARYLHVDKGMPLDMVRQYLRHEDLETTQGYLDLAGGYTEEEMRRWLSK